MSDINTKRKHINLQLLQNDSYINILKLCDKYFFQNRILELIKEKRAEIMFYKSKVPRIIPMNAHKYKIYLPNSPKPCWFEFICTLLLIFLHEPKNKYDAEDIARELYKKIFLCKAPVLKPPIAYQNWNESCYIDSLLVCIFFGGKTFQNINMHKNTSKISNQLIAALNYDYELITGKMRYKTLQCNKIRDIIRMIIPHSLGSFGVSETFDALTDTFPCMKTKNIPYVNLHNTIATSYVREKSQSLFSTSLVSMWDFIDGDTIRSRLGRIIIWDNFDHPFITFQNTLAPHIKKFGNVSSEILSTNNKKNVHHKIQCFSEYILDKRYKLVYVISHKSPKESLESGHYVVFIRPNFDPKNWYEYDDLRKGWIKLDYLPNEVFTDNEWMRPELLYYEKTKRIVSNVCNNIHNDIYRDVFMGKRVKLCVIYASKITIILYGDIPALTFCVHTPNIVMSKQGICYKWKNISHSIACAILNAVKLYDIS